MLSYSYYLIGILSYYTGTNTVQIVVAIPSVHHIIQVCLSVVHSGGSKPKLIISNKETISNKLYLRASRLYWSTFAQLARLFWEVLQYFLGMEYFCLASEAALGSTLVLPGSMYGRFLLETGSDAVHHLSAKKFSNEFWVSMHGG